MSTVASGRAATVHAVARDNPELALLAAVIARAVADATGGDMAALVWLQSKHCLRIMCQLAPNGTDPRALQQRMLNKLEAERD